MYYLRNVPSLSRTWGDSSSIEYLVEVVLGMCRRHAATTVHCDNGRRQRYVDLDELGMQDVELVPPEATRWQFISCGLTECVVCRRDGKYWNGKRVR